MEKHISEMSLAELQVRIERAREDERRYLTEIKRRDIPCENPQCPEGGRCYGECVRTF